MDDNKFAHIKSQAELIHNFNDKYRPNFNEELFVRNNQDIIDAVSKVIRSCEKDKYFTLKVLSIDAITSYEEIHNTLRWYYESQKKKSTKDLNPYDFIQIKDSDIILLKVTYFLQKNGIERMKIDGKDVDVENPHTTLDVLIEIPRFVEKYYFRLQGNYYIPINQISDSSTYNNSTTNSSKHDNVTFKTLFMSVRIYRMFKFLVDVNSKQKIKFIIYTSLIFNKHVNAMFYILAKYGLYATLEFFHAGFINVTNVPCTDPGKYCFKKHNIYISVPKTLMDDEPIVQSLVCTILDGISKDATVDDLFKWDYWLTVLGYTFKNNTADKGIFVLDSLESIYDIITRETLRIPDDQKRDIYHVLKWIMCEFSNLRAKDNVDVSIKRIRLAEYIAQIYAMKLTKGIHRISDLGKKVKLKQIVSAIRTKPDYIISRIILMSNLVSYADNVNDNDAIQVLKYSYKGIAGLGEDGAKVQPVYRFVDPSHLGILDLDSSSVSDPGMTGIIVPTAKLYNGGFFTDFEEVHEWDEEYQKKLDKYNEEHHKINPFIPAPGYEYSFDYDHVKDYNIKKSLGSIKVNPFIDLSTSQYNTTPQQKTMEEIGEQKVDMSSIFNLSDDALNQTPTEESENAYVPYSIQNKENKWF